MSENTSKAKNSQLGKEILHLGGVLLIITIVVAGLLGVVNAVTKDKIAENKQLKIQNAISQIAPDTDASEIEFTTEDSTVTAVYQLKANGENAGLCVQVVNPEGFGGDITLMVGVDPENKIIGVQIVSLAETPGLGTKANDSEWLSQYNGLSGPLNIVKNTKTGDNDIVAVSGATITSTAVTHGVQSALDVAATLQGEVAK